MRQVILGNIGKKVVFLMSKVTRIGVITEDVTDYEAIRVLIKRIASVDGVGFKQKNGGGCSKIMNKCVGWATDLKRSKCDMLIVVHDLDDKDHDSLLRKLNEKLSVSPISNYYACIPIQELEAWFLGDPEGIKKAYGLSRSPKVKGFPEDIESPKEYLRDQIYSCSNKEIDYITIHNKLIAESVELSELRKRCPSFQKFSDFILSQKYA